jgi:hypothetical protein
LNISKRLQGAATDPAEAAVSCRTGRLLDAGLFSATFGYVEKVRSQFLSLLRLCRRSVFSERRLTIVESQRI